MFYWVSKLVWFFMKPTALMFLLPFIGVLVWMRWRRAGMVLIATGLFLQAMIVLTPIGSWALVWWEGAETVRIEDLPKPDGIIVLGGAIETLISQKRGVIALEKSGERITEMGVLARRFPDAKIIFSGGASPIKGGTISEASLAKKMLTDLGLDTGRIQWEDAALNTAQNASLSYAMAKPQPGEVWWLVTSAFHMPRAMGCFRAVDWNVVPYPVDYRTPTANSVMLKGFRSRIEAVDLVSTEIVGSLVYWLTGRAKF